MQHCHDEWYECGGTVYESCPGYHVLRIAALLAPPNFSDSVAQQEAQQNRGGGAVDIPARTAQDAFRSLRGDASLAEAWQRQEIAIRAVAGKGVVALGGDSSGSGAVNVGSEPRLSVDGALGYAFQARTFLFTDRPSMSQHDDAQESLFDAQACDGEQLCGVDLRSRVMQNRFYSKWQDEPTVGSDVGKFQTPLLEYHDALERVGALVKDAPILWMPARAPELYADFEAARASSLGSLTAAVLLLVLSLGPACLLTASSLLHPLLPAKYRRRLERCALFRYRAEPAPSSWQDFVGEAPAEQRGAGPAPWFPSCTWRGFYHQYGSQHTLCSFPLHFSEEGGRVEGEGTDDVGRYVVSGLYNPATRKVAFRKEYLWGSSTVGGEVDWRENKGHAVEYRGEALGGPGEGFAGTWWIRTASYTGRGIFRLWPEQLPPAPALPGPAAAQALRGYRGTVGGGYRVSEDGVCVVCFARDIDVMLVPCGHIAICGACSRQVRSSRAGCPICRAAIENVVAA